MEAGFELFLKRQGLAKRTQSQILSRAEKLIASCQPFNKQTVDKFLVSVSDKFSNATVNKYVQAVKKICAYENLDWGKTVTRLTERSPARLTLSDTEIERLISLENYSRRVTEKWQVYFSLLAFTGARPGEILRLRSSDFDLSDHTVSISSTKTNDIRIVPIAEVIRHKVYAYIKKIKDRLFNVTHSAVLKEFNRRISELGIERNVTPYSLRHSFITRMVGEADLFDVQSIVGHKKATTTQIYVHKNLKTKRKAIKKDPLSRRSLKPEEVLNLLKQQISEELSNYGVSENKHFSYEIHTNRDGFELKIHIK
jgi:integrase/recombinase XerD